MDRALPLYPILPACDMLWDAHIAWAARAFERALARTRECTDGAPTHSSCWVFGALSEFEAGRRDAARRNLERLSSLRGGRSPPAQVDVFASSPELRDRRKRFAREFGLSMAQR